MKRDKRGFTLLEVIVTMTLAAILGAILVTYMGSNITASVFPLVRVQQEYTLNQIMENINSDYRKLLLENPDPLGALQSRINSGYYGTYTVANNVFIMFDGSGAEQTGGNRILKVSLSQGDHKLTTLFTK